MRKIQMNERIAKLANQAGFDVDNTGKFGNYSEMARAEKFAELIVRECADIADKAEPYKANELIKEHFGVEE